MPSVSNLQGGGAGTGTAGGRLGTRTSGREITVGSQGPGKGLPGSVAEQRLWQVPGEVVGSKLREGRHTRPCLFCRSPWRIGMVRSLYCKGSTQKKPTKSTSHPAQSSVLLGGQSSGDPWWRRGGCRGKLTQETEDEVQFLLDSRAWEEGLPSGHLIEDAAHAPGEARATVRPRSTTIPPKASV